jgi:hypothetical protein
MLLLTRSLSFSRTCSSLLLLHPSLLLLRMRCTLLEPSPSKYALTPPGLAFKFRLNEGGSTRWGAAASVLLGTRPPVPELYSCCSETPGLSSCATLVPSHKPTKTALKANNSSTTQWRWRSHEAPIIAQSYSNSCGLMTSKDKL